VSARDVAEASARAEVDVLATVVDVPVDGPAVVDSPVDVDGPGVVEVVDGSVVVDGEAPAPLIA
jgi:hypothetical protein